MPIFGCDLSSNVPPPGMQDGQVLSWTAGGLTPMNASQQPGGPHTHTISDIEGLQFELDGKAPTAHGHVISDITGLQTALDGKANAIHTHAGLPIMARVSADISQSSNVTFSNIWTLAILANQIWSFEAVVFFTAAAATTGIVIQVDSPTSPTFSQCGMFTQETATASRYLAAAANATMIGTAAVIAPAINCARVCGTIENGANNGNIVVKFRSEVNASAVTVKRGSFVRFYQQ